MSTASSAPSRRPPEAGPICLGWRPVTVTRPDGTEDVEWAELTPEDLLHPEEGDQILQAPGHINDLFYLHGVLTTWLRDDPTALVVTDGRVAWDVPGLKPHGPDVAVFFGVEGPHRRTTFDVARRGVRPTVIIEVVSPEDARVRANDVVIKVKHYHRVRVLLYVVVDNLGSDDERRLSLIAHDWHRAGYRRRKPHPRGRVWLEPLGIWLGVADDPTYGQRVTCIDPGTDQEIGDYTQISQELVVTKQARVEAEQARVEAEARAEAEGRLRAEAQAEAEALRAELRRLRGDS